MPKERGTAIHFSTQSALAWALLQKGEVPESQLWIERALSSGARAGGLFGTASAVYQAAGDFSQGRHYAELIDAVNPHGHGFHMHH